MPTTTARLRSPLTIAIAIGLAVFGWFEAPREIARWYAAAAREASLAGDFRSMMSAATRATRWSPASPHWWLMRVRAQMGLEQWEGALKDIDQLEQRSRPSLQTRLLRADVLQHLGKFDEALDEWKKVAPAIPSSDDSAGSHNPAKRQLEMAKLLTLGNGLAYARALAKRELSEAEADAKRVVALADDIRLRVAARPYMALAQAVTLAEFNQHRRALGLVNTAIAELRRLVHRYQSRATAVKDFSPQRYADELRALRSMLVSAYVEQYHIFAELGLAKPARQAAEMVARLNGDIDLDGWGVELSGGIQSASDLGSVLDTLALVQLELGQPEKARANFETALAIAETLLPAHRTLVEVEKLQRVDARMREQQAAEVSRTVAVILYHRGLAFEALGKPEQAAKDYQRVREFGFEPDSKLF